MMATVRSGSCPSPRARQAGWDTSLACSGDCGIGPPHGTSKASTRRWGLSLLTLVLGAAKSRAHCGQDQAGYDVMAEFSKWLEAGEESIFSLETEKNLSGEYYEVPEAAARTQKFSE